jgi:hypothetical protein
MTNYRKSNFFERVLLIVGLLVIIVGFYFIYQVFQSSPGYASLGWESLQTIFLWLMLVVLIVLLATEEDVKEELAIIIKEHIEETKIMKEETKLLRELNHEQLNELKLLREINTKTKPKKRK